MGDWMQRLVDVDVSPAEAPALGQRVVADLIERGVLGGELSPCGLGPGDLAYPPGPRWADAVAEPDGAVAASFPKLAVKGVELEFGRTIGWMHDDVQVFCPTCGNDLSSSDFYETVGRWLKGHDGELLRCASCLIGTPVELVISVPACAPANLALMFWNWPRLHDDFVAHLRTILSPHSVRQWSKL